MSVALIIVSFIVVLFVLVSSHELGHMVAAKRAGVKVEEFGIGFPPRLFAIKRGETSYSVNLIPLGAFVRTPGENDPAVPGSLASKGPWTRLGVYAAGPIVNVVVAFIILSVFFMLPYDVVRGDGIMVNHVSERSPAEEEGVKPGDVILKIDEQEVRERKDVQEALNSNGGEEKSILVSRGREQFEIDLAPEFDSDEGQYIMGVLLWWGIVTEVESGSSAEEAGISPGDTIVGIDGKQIISDATMFAALDAAEGKEEVSLILLRDGEDISKTLKPSPQGVFELTGIGTQWVSHTQSETERRPIWQAIYRGGHFVVRVPYLIKESIPIIREDPGKAVAGPIGAAQLTVEAVKASGFGNVLLLAGIISIGLALFNFIPIPPLDGGGMLIGLIEGVRRGKRLSARTVRLAYVAGTALILTLFVGIMYNDIVRLIDYIRTGEGVFGL